jgi:signal transduction histidine kinase/ligand-binding sensor domain-containing protein/DNA-binding response OmpR family regulator
MKTLLKKISVLLLLAVSWYGVNGQDVNLKARHLAVDQGLSHSDATSIVQDQKGFTWIGTYAGLNRYDGYKLKNYTNHGSLLRSVYLNRINNLCTSKAGLIWLATQGGLVCFDPFLERFLDLQVQDSSLQEQLKKPISHVLADPWDNLFCIVDQNLLILNVGPSHKLSVLKTPSLKGALLNELKMAPDGKVWVVSNRGLFELEAKTARAPYHIQQYRVLDEQGSLRRDVHFLSFDAQGKLYLGAPGAVLLVEGQLMDQDSHNLHCRTVQIPSAVLNTPPDQKLNITGIEKDIYTDRLWVGTPLGLLTITTPFGAATLAASDLIEHHISQLFMDKLGSLWAGTFGAGVAYLNLNPKPFYSLSHREKNPKYRLSGDYVRAIVEDKEGKLWIGTRSAGLNCYHPQTQEMRWFKHKPGEKGSINSDQIRALATDRNGFIWVGTDQGLNRFNGASFENITAIPGKTPGLSTPVIFSIATDVFGQVWAGSWEKGLNRIRYRNPGDYTIRAYFKGPQSLCGDRITFIYADPQRPELIVCTTEGLNHVFLDSHGDISKIYHYKGQEGKKDQLSSDFVWPVVRTDANTLWVGTLGGGLNKVTLLGQGRYRAEHFTTEQGLPSNDVESILCDAQGNLWLGSKGLTKFNPVTHQVVNFDANDGLQGNVFKIGSACAGRDGKLYFGGLNGLSYFHPESIRISSSKTKVAITGVMVNNHFREGILQANPQDRNGYTQKLVLNHLENNFTLEFSALHYVNPEKCRYRYKLEGFNPDWVEVDAQVRQATFSNLDYGEYQFKLLASNADAQWSETPLKMKIWVNPPWWRSTWAKLLYALLAITLITLAYRYQLQWLNLKKNLDLKNLEEKKQEELHQLRIQFFTNISHELRTPLSLIMGPIGTLQQQTPAQDPKHKSYQLILRNTQRLQALVQELLEFRKAESGATQLKATKTKIVPFLSHICQGFEELAVQKGLILDLQIDPKLEPSTGIWLDRGIVEKILNNLLSNAIKYTKASGSVKVELCEQANGSYSDSIQLNFGRDETDLIWVKVADTGLGMEESVLKQIFERFYRVTDSEHDAIQGSGIGLALVKSLTSVQRGALAVFSAPGQGTEFFLGLPIGSTYLNPQEIISFEEYQQYESAQDEQETNRAFQLATNAMGLFPELDEKVEAITESTYKRSSGPQKLLIVEDNDELRQFLRDSFRDQFEVWEAEDGLMGLHRALEIFPDLIISDIMMPELDGISFCKAVRDNLDISHTPFILLTAKNSIESQIQGAEVGADAYLAKPFSLQLLQLTVQNLLETREKLKAQYAQRGVLDARELASNKRDKEFIDQLLVLIEAKLEDADFEVEQLCRGLGMSRSSLYNKVQSIIGIPVGELVRKARLHRAAQLLVQGEMSVFMVMDQVGIQSQSYFTKAFKKEFGKTPTQYVGDFVAKKE